MTDSIKLYNIDCVEYMKSIPDKYFDLAVVDPPYGIDRGGQKEIICKNPKHKRKAHKQKNWDNETPNAEYFKELFRVSKNQIIWGANYFVEYLDKGTMGWIFWYKGQQGLTMSDGEIAYSSFQRATRMVNLNRGLIAHNGGSIHPTQKPVALYDWILEKYSRPTDKILDTHLGSGSSAIAAHRFGISEFVGCELDKEYFDAACKRFKEQTAQMSIL